MEEEPFPSSSSSSFLLKDISNFKTPKRPSKNPNFNSPCPQFFTASKQTPRSSSSFRHRSRPSLAPSSSRSKAKVVAKLKAFELKQSQSARKEQLKKEQSLKSLSKSLTVWLNFLFQNPKSCGCDLSINGGDDSNVVRVDSGWRSPKRMRELWWRGEESENVAAAISSSKYSTLRSSLKEVCSFDDLKQRMQIYLSLGSCKEIFNAMTNVVKNIDEGRLKMKAHCPIVTDVGMKEKACKILMSYNPIWLRIGLYIIFGGDSLLSSDGDISSGQDISFLKMVIEKQFFSNTGLAKAYAYNKKVEGLYRPGYYENLGNVILKRILLLALILDRAKSQTSLPLKYGIDGVDGGSPLLFTVSSGIKSSRQVLNDFLPSDVMHGEGNLLAHLVIVGYKVSHQQSALVEFDFQVSDLFVDLQDGVRLCRVIQLLQHDPSILMKILVPSDTQKKNLANCGVALQYLRQAGVMLCDEDGLKIMGDDIADGDKELTLSLLWNIFIHLQLPLLIDKTIIADEISKILGFNMNNLNVLNSTLLEMLLNWIQAICEKYDLKIDNFSSLVNGKAIWCLLDYYFRKELSCSCSNKDSHETRGEESIMSATYYTDAVHSFVLSQKLAALLGNFPEVLQVSELLEHNGAVSDQSVVVLLVFLLSQLIVKKNVDQLNFHKLLGCNCQNLERRHSLTRRQSASSEAAVHKKERDSDITEDAAKKFKAIQAWWRDMTEQNCKTVVRPAASTSYCFIAQKTSIDIPRENAAIVIQSHFRRLIERRKFLKMMKAICLMKTVIRAWLTVKKNSELNKFSLARVQEYPSEVKRFVKFIVERHNFLNLRRSVLLIQQAARIWIAQRRDASCPDLVSSAIFIQKCVRGWMVRSRDILGHAHIENASLKCREKGLSNSEIEAATRIQIAWKNFVCRSLYKQTYAAIKIQSHYRGWRLRSFMKQKQAITKIQSNFRRLKCWRAFQIARKEFVCISLQNQTFAATKIQSHFRGWQLRSFMKQKQAIIKIQSNFRRLKCWRAFQIAWKEFICRSLQNQAFAATKIQSHFRGWQLRSFMKQKQAIIKIQSNFRRLKCWRAFQIARKEFVCRSLQNQTFAATKIQSHFRGWQLRRSFMKQKQAIIKIQSNFRRLKCLSAFQQYKIAAKSAIIIQSYVRGWIAQRQAWRYRYLIVVIQRHCRGWLVRKELLLQRDAVKKIQRAIWCLKCQKAFHFQKQAAIEIQRFIRGQITRNWLVRKELLLQRDAVTKIQRAIRCLKCQKAFHFQKQAAIEIQRFIRGQITRNRFLGASSLHATTTGSCNFKMSEGSFWSFELTLVITSVLKLQRWWRGVLLLKLRTKSAIIIQSHTRGWIARQEADRKRHSIVVIQSYWKGYVARKESRGQLMDLRLRMLKSAMNVDDSRRIINRLLSALSELLSMKSISGILHNCETLDMTTAHSQKCCEELVAAGAIGILLKLIRSASRSIPDQEVLKHALSTLRNLARYPHLTEVLIDTPGSVEIILWELHRNKEEGYFIASEILKKICSNQKGVKAVHKFPALLKRLHNLVDELTRKANIEKRNHRAVTVRENTERRLREAVELLKLITNG